VTQRLQQLIAETDLKVGMVLCAGPVPMMRAVAEVTRPLGIHTVASLNPIMVDGTGMCGGCRVQVDGKTLFACVDGPEFDAHKVDFRELSDRLTTYRGFERAASERCQCKVNAVAEGR
jgi:ferredoxin--NADP+ reductase